MYKVFIDNKPLVIGNNSMFSTKSQRIYAHELIDFPNDIEAELNNITIDNPLLICSQDLDRDFKRLFEGYDLIEAAGGIVESKEGFLIIERNGFWDIPKGKMEKEETPEESALREIEEECGIYGHVIDQLLTITYHTYLFKGRLVLKKTYWYKLNYSGNDILTPQLDEGITKAQWFTKNRIPEIRLNTYGSIHEVLDAYESL
ncbi:MAG: NUDIX domain-containing protein [Crocinitomicaceae bacterium]